MTEEAIARAYALPTLREVQEVAPRCRIGHAAGQSTNIVLLAGDAAARSVLLVRRNHAPYVGLYALPGGHIDRSEQPLDAAARTLHEATGMVLPNLSFAGTYDGAERDPRLLTSHAYLGVLGSARTPAPGSDAVWVPVQKVADGDIALAFDHPRLLRDALVMADGQASPYLAHLGVVASAADRRNSSLLDEVDRFFGRGIATDRDVLLAEYAALKGESTQRIQQRDNFINLNLIAVAAVASVVANTQSASFALLAIPWATLCFGWVYLANDEKISALSDYCEYYLGPKLGREQLAWERSPKRATNIKRTHKTAQLLVDLLQFVAPVIGAPIALWSMIGFDEAWVNIVGGIEIMFGIGLATAFLLGSHLTSRFDVKQEDWEAL